jgi:osmotically-inducible protein OsmY
MRNVILLAVAVCSLSGPAHSFPIDPRVDPRVAQERVAKSEDRDAALAQKVKRSLVGDATPDPYGIEVVARNGIVQLYGSVYSEPERKRMEITAAGVTGVRGVENRIVIDPGV